MDESNINCRMDLTTSIENAKVLGAEMQWLAGIIDTRFKLYWGQECEYTDIYDIAPPDLSGNDSMYAQILRHYKMNVSERIILLLSLAPHLQPHLLDVFY